MSKWDYADDLFGEMRHSTPEEQEAFATYLRRNSIEFTDQDIFSMQDGQDEPKGGNVI